MKQYLLFSISSLLIAVLLFCSCKKESPTEKSVLLQSKINELIKKPKTNCQLLTLDGGGSNFYFHYNEMGLCDYWDISGYGQFKQEYNEAGHIVISRLFDRDNLKYTIHFNYENDLVASETWYDGNSSIISDEVFYSYNSKGELVKGESVLKNYYTIYTYTIDGNTASWKYYLSGIPYFAGYYTYNQPIKNPYLAVTGIEHGFPFINASYFKNKWWASGEKFVIFDEKGVPITQYNYNPRQTVYQGGDKSYPLSCMYYDMISYEKVPYYFEYGNCVTGQRNTNVFIKSAASTTDQKINQLWLLKLSTNKSIQIVADAIRKQFIELRGNQ